MAKIHFFSEDVDFKLKQKTDLRNWINGAAVAEGYKISELNFIFCSDDYLLDINQQYLQHDTYTDIVTFDNSEQEGKLIGDLFISVERVADNAKQYEIAFEDELHRVMIHGVLHLLGYLDKTASDQKQMTEKENHYLALRFSIK